MLKKLGVEQWKVHGFTKFQTSCSFSFSFAAAAPHAASAASAAAAAAAALTTPGFATAASASVTTRPAAAELPDFSRLIQLIHMSPLFFTGLARPPPCSWRCWRCRAPEDGSPERACNLDLPMAQLLYEDPYHKLLVPHIVDSKRIIRIQHAHVC